MRTVHTYLYVTMCACTYMFYIVLQYMNWYITHISRWATLQIVVAWNLSLWWSHFFLHLPSVETSLAEASLTQYNTVAVACRCGCLRQDVGRKLHSLGVSLYHYIGAASALVLQPLEYIGTMKWWAGAGFPRRRSEPTPAQPVPVWQSNTPPDKPWPMDSPVPVPWRDVVTTTHGTPSRCPCPEDQWRHPSAWPPWVKPRPPGGTAAGWEMGSPNDQVAPPAGWKAGSVTSW